MSLTSYLSLVHNDNTSANRYSVTVNEERTTPCCQQKVGDKYKRSPARPFAKFAPAQMDFAVFKALDSVMFMFKIRKEIKRIL